MISPKANKQTQPKVVVRPKSSLGEGPMLSGTVLSQDAIRSRAMSCTKTVVVNMVRTNLIGFWPSKKSSN